MDPEEQEQYANQVAIHGQVGQNATATAQAQYYNEEKELGLADAQLEVDTIKEDIFHLLRQDVKQIIKGKFGWANLKSQSERTLSNWGVDRLMQIIHFYINKNNLLSNFSEIQINRLMLKFIKELNDLILLKYQVLFREPTFEECKEIILKKLDNRKKMKLFSLEVLGQKGDDKKIEKELLEETEATLEKEMEKVRKETKKEKIRDYGLIIVQLEIIVFATLNRAWKGEERGSLRRHMNVSELVGSKPIPMQQNKGGVFGWGRK